MQERALFLAQPVQVGELIEQGKAEVRHLAAILRVADGLDRGHRRHVRSVTARKLGKGVNIEVNAESGSDLEVWSAKQKADLLEAIAGGPVRIRLMEA